MLNAIEGLSPAKTRKLVRAVALCLWPNGGGDTTTEWNADTLDAIAGVFLLFGVNPDDK